MESVASIKWSEDVFDILKVIESSEFPQIIRVYDDVSNKSGSKILSKDEILKLHGLKTFKKAVITEAGRTGDNGQLLAMPLCYPERIQVLPLKSKGHLYATVGDLIRETPRPRAVIVNKKVVLYEKSHTINAGDILTISSVDKRCTSAGVVDYLLCRHHEKTIGLPTTCTGNFSALVDEVQYTIKEVIKTFEFPQRIKFLPHNNNSISSSMKGCEDLAECEYIVHGMQKQQYAICTDSHTTGIRKSDWLYLIPTDSLRGRRTLFQLPLFHDLSSYKTALGYFCENLSMKHIVDCIPVEQADSQDIFKCVFGDVYDLITPTLPRRKHSPGEGADHGAATLLSHPVTGSASGGRKGVSISAVSQQVTSVGVQRGLTCGTDVAGLSGLHSFDDGAGVYETLTWTGAGGSNAAHDAMVRTPPAHSPQSLRRGSVGLGSSSHPNTPQIGRQRKAKASNWTEKLAQSLSSLKIGGGGSNGAVQKKNAKKKQEETSSLAHRRLVDASDTSSEEDVSAESSALHSSTGSLPSVRLRHQSPASDSVGLYENADAILQGSSIRSAMAAAHPQKFTAPSAVVSTTGKPVGTTRPIMKQSSAAPSVVRELWTPPCSPDYRDHTTSAFELHLLDGPSSASCGASLHSDDLCPHTSCISSPPSARVAAMARISPPVDEACRTPSGATRVDANPSFSCSIARSGCTAGSCDDALDDAPIYANVLYSFPRGCDVLPLPLPRRHANGDIVSINGSQPSTDRGLALTVPGLGDSIVSVKTLADVPDDLSSLSVVALCSCLNLYNMHVIADKFQQQQVDGHFFMAMTETMFRDKCFGLSDFEVLKLKRLQNGWRPKLD